MQEGSTVWRCAGRLGLVSAVTASSAREQDTMGVGWRRFTERIHQGAPLQSSGGLQPTSNARCRWAGLERAAHSLRCLPWVTARPLRRLPPASHRCPLHSTLTACGTSFVQDPA